MLLLLRKPYKENNDWDVIKKIYIYIKMCVLYTATELNNDYEFFFNNRGIIKIKVMLYIVNVSAKNN